MDLSRAFVNFEGIEFDRWFMVVDLNGKFITAREHPILYQLKATPIQNGLVLSMQGKNDMIVNINNIDKNKKKTISVWVDTTQPLPICNQDVNDWLSDILKVKVELIFMDNRKSRINEYLKVPVSFADRSPVHLLSIASLQDVQKYCPIECKMNRLRPNIVIEGCAPYEEDSWKTIKIGNVILENVQQKWRCILVNTDPDNGKKHRQEPLKTFMERRQAVEDGKAYLGTSLVPKNEGVISLYDKVEILERKTPMELKNYKDIVSK